MAIDSIANLTESMNSATLLDSICGRDFEAILAYFTQISADYTELHQNVTSVIEHLDCETIRPIYIELVHHILCKEVPFAGVWAIGALFIISLFSMLMITFRASWLENLEPSDDSKFVPVKSFHMYDLAADNFDDDGVVHTGSALSPPPPNKPKKQVQPKKKGTARASGSASDGETKVVENKPLQKRNSDRSKSTKSVQSIGYDVTKVMGPSRSNQAKYDDDDSMDNLDPLGVNRRKEAPEDDIPHIFEGYEIADFIDSDDDEEDWFAGIVDDDGKLILSKK